MLTRYNSLTSQQKQQIIALFNDGWECRNIPNHLGVTEFL